MKIVILTNHDLASLYALNLLLPELSDHQLLLGISDKVGGNESRSELLQNLAHYEQSQMNGIVLPESLTCGGKILYLDNFNKLCKQHTIDLEAMNHINQANGMSIIKRFAPSLILSIRFGKILQQEVINIPTYGVLNLHSGILPNYQGVMASFWAMLRGESHLGTCLHFITDNKIDSGEIIQQSKMPIITDRSYLFNVLSLYAEGCDLMIQAVGKLQQGLRLKAKPQQGEASYFGFPVEKDLQQFAELGFKLYDNNEFS